MRKIIVSGLLASLLVASSALAGMHEKEYAGHCAWGLTMGKQDMTDCKINWIDPKTQKTFCFSSEEAKSNWAKDIGGNMAKSTSQYQKVSSEHLTRGDQPKPY